MQRDYLSIPSVAFHTHTHTHTHTGSRTYAGTHTLHALHETRPGSSPLRTANTPRYALSLKHRKQKDRDRFERIESRSMARSSAAIEEHTRVNRNSFSIDRVTEHARIVRYHGPHCNGQILASIQVWIVPTLDGADTEKSSSMPADPSSDPTLRRIIFLAVQLTVVSAFPRST